MTAGYQCGSEGVNPRAKMENVLHLRTRWYFPVVDRITRNYACETDVEAVSIYVGTRTLIHVAYNSDGPCPGPESGH